MTEYGKVRGKEYELRDSVGETVDGDLERDEIDDVESDE